MTNRRLVVASGALVALACGSCDSLKARQQANEAAGLYKKGDLREAAEVYSRAEQLDPNIATIHLNLGFAYLSLFNGSPKSVEAKEWGRRAIEEFEAYIKMKPADGRGRQFLLQTFIDTRRYDDAVAFFKPELERAEPSLEAISLLGQIAAKVGRLEDALGWYQKRVDLRPNETEGLDGLGVLIWDHLHNHVEVTGMQRIGLADRGIASLKRSSELNPNPQEPFVYINLLYRERATAHPCYPATDGGTAASGTPDGGVGAGADGGSPLGGCLENYQDLKEAEKYYEIAKQKALAASGAKPPAAPAAPTGKGPPPPPGASGAPPPPAAPSAPAPPAAPTAPGGAR